MESQLRDFFLQLKNRDLLGDLNTRNLDVEHCVSTVIHHSLKGKVKGVVLLDDDNVIQGIYICSVAYQWFDMSTRSLSEMMLFVMPEYRKGRNFIRMLNRIEQICKAEGIETLQVGNAMKIDVKHFEGVLHHSGFKTYPVYRKQL